MELIDRKKRRNLQVRTAPPLKPECSLTIHLLVIPIVAEYNDVEAWTPLIASIDAVIDTVGGRPVEPVTKGIFEAVTRAAAEKRSPDAPKLAFVVTSGTCVHGHNDKDLVNDTTPIGAFTPPAPFAEWRVAHDQAVIKSTVVNGIVIRPVLLYGRSGSLMTMLFKSAYEGTVKWWGEPGQRWTSFTRMTHESSSV